MMLMFSKLPKDYTKKKSRAGEVVRSQSGPTLQNLGSAQYNFNCFVFVTFLFERQFLCVSPFVLDKLFVCMCYAWRVDIA